jgi:hypothetical protein
MNIVLEVGNAIVAEAKRWAKHGAWRLEVDNDDEFDFIFTFKRGNNRTRFYIQPRAEDCGRTITFEEHYGSGYNNFCMDTVVAPEGCVTPEEIASHFWKTIGSIG